MVKSTEVMGNHSITCPKCHGSGKKPLTKVYTQTLDLIRRLGNPTIADLQKHIKGVCPTAINQRVKRLKEFGVVTTSVGRPMRVACV